MHTAAELTSLHLAYETGNAILGKPRAPMRHGGCSARGLLRGKKTYPEEISRVEFPEEPHHRQSPKLKSLIIEINHTNDDPSSFL